MSPIQWRDPHAFAGRLEQPVLASTILRDNALGDPVERNVHVYVPPDAEREPLGVILVLAAFTGRPDGLLEMHPWKTGVVRQFDQAVEAGVSRPALLVMPDCFTWLGGSQYVNSSATGSYRDYVVQEVLPFVEERYDTTGRRAVCGKSSGGFGALHLAMQHPELFDVAASISGDCHFEHGYAHDFLPAARGLLKYDSDPAAFLKSFNERPELGGDGHAVLSLLAMAACYSPNPNAALGFDLPIDPHTGERVHEVWQRWLEFDRVVACARYADALRSLDWLYLEAGRRDEFNLQFGLRVLVDRLQELGIPHEHAEHEGGHFGLNERYATLLPRIAQQLAAR